MPDTAQMLLEIRVGLADALIPALVLLLAVVSTLLLLAAMRAAARGERR